ncbi:MAG TPA: DUF3276 family protein [Crocinitomicaceae bacterium]|nr:DUF3276 family protein [Crocinitomicaceae bacterium]
MFEDNNYNEKDGVFSKAVKAGRRTYFFDVKTTRDNDFYITITESKKFSDGDSERFEKHKIFLYKEDFEKFEDALGEALSKIKELKG